MEPTAREKKLEDKLNSYYFSLANIDSLSDREREKLYRSIDKAIARMGEELGIEGLGALDKSHLIFEILKANAERSGQTISVEDLPDTASAASASSDEISFPIKFA